jgi:ribosomal protein S18 acetylase RimI-like enzyme
VHRTGRLVEGCAYRFAQEADLQTLCSELSEEAWGRLSGLLKRSCTQPDWVVLAFAGKTLTATLALVTHTEFGLPLELFEFHGSLKGRNDSLELLQFVIEKARSLGSRELFYTVSADSAGTETISNAGFRHWRNTVRLKSTKPGDIEMQGYRSCATDAFERSEIIALLEQVSELSADSQIQFYRERLGGMGDAEMTLKAMEYTDYDPDWWRVALNPGGQLIGIVLPVLVYGEPTIGFIGVRPECRGRKIAQFLVAEAWSIMRRSGWSTLYAEADQRNASMYRALISSGFTLQCRKQEWRLDLSE